MNNKEWEDKATEILLYATERRDFQKNMVMDAGLCHGTVGNAHIFKRMFLNTGKKEFNEAAEYWYNASLKMASYKNSITGYKAFRTEEYGGYTEDFGFLEGAAGIGLALLSAISDIEPKWDEILLLS